MKQEKLLTTKELAKRLSVSPATVSAWTRRGCIPARRLSPKVIRYELPAVLAALSSECENRGSGASNA